MAYIWNTDTNSLQLEEKTLFITIIILGIFLFVLLTLVFPKLYNTYSQMFNWDSGGLEFLLFIIAIIEVYYHFAFRLHYLERDLYSNIQSKLVHVMIAVTLFGGIYGFIVACYYGKCTTCIRSSENFCSIYIFITCFAAYSLPVLIEAFIYPTEVVSTIGFIMIAIAIISAGHTILKRRTRSGSNSKSISKSTKCQYHLQMGFLCACLYFIIPTAVYVLLVFYLSLLKLLLESPTSQLFQLILTLVPVIVGICSLIVQKKLSGDDSDDETKRVQERRKHKRGYRRLVNEEDDQPQNSTSTREQNQPESRQPWR